ncbi:TPA: O-antigen ligase family protein [Vibrio vulnificus]|nr:O-antigen ligase family protein [Vibrio vulnificus]HDY7687591.1 O-antigen ligase family protein [Vibrio vulnificus]
MNSMIRLFPILIILPVAINIFSVSGKPVYFVLSDICFFVFPLVMLLGFKRFDGNKHTLETKSLLILVVISVFVMVVIGVIGSIRLGGDYLPIISSVRLMKSHFFFVIGVYLALHIRSDNLLRIFRITSLLVVSIFVFSDVIWGNFPYPRLGGLFFNSEVYGFPNSSAVFYSVFFASIVNGLINSKSKIMTLVYALASITLIAIITATLSRAGMLNVILFMLLMLFSGGKGYKFIFIISVISIFSLTSYLMINFPDLLVGLESKFDKFDDNQDLSNGRFDIWIHALDLFSQKPILGYFFEPFSNYSLHDTPHNQYIELLYKVGFIGLVAYLLPAMYALFKLKSSNASYYSDAKLGELRLITIALVVCILVTNNVQPNLSYTPTGVLIYFLLGFTLCKVTQRHNLGQRNETSITRHG